MDISELTIGALTSVPVRQDYPKSGQCFRYGSHGHQVKSCIWPPESTSSGSGKQVTITAVNDDYSGTESDNDSGEGCELPPGLDWTKLIARE
jgi:hypothetical protein